MSESKRYKLMTEQGLLLTFSSMDQLSSGDLFLHGVEIKSTLQQAVEQTHPATPGYEPSAAPARKAFKPKVEPRVGIMCPHCHQSRILLYSIEKCNHDDDIFDWAMVFSFDTKNLFILKITQISKPAGMAADFETMGGPSAGWKPDAEDMMKLEEFMKTPDIIINGLGEALMTTLADIASEWSPDKNCMCPECGEIRTIQEWINEYANPTAGFHDICRICGGEMAINCADGFRGDVMKQPMKCEVCGYENKRDLTPEAGVSR